ncbi:hypothetical protein GCM10009846_31470 [Agrococcus versicolor]|uniref:SHOCT domain-containing protein n=1 Tax=Agrococcus versicolor TaxID=501482 RepID=A0ABP5MTN6_9MICO
MAPLQPLLALPADGMPEWLRIAIGVIVVGATLVGIGAMISALRRNRDLQDGAPPLPHRPWSRPDEPGFDARMPGPPSPVAPDDATLEQRLDEIDAAHAEGRIDATERERARRDLLGDDPDGDR